MKRGLDVGNYSLKEYPSTNIKSLVTTEENLLGSKLKLEYEGKTYFIGEGVFETELNKCSKSNFLPLLLTGIALNSTKDDVYQKIICGLPINQYRTNKNDLEDFVLSNKIKNIKFNGEPRRIIIEDFKVYPEAVGAYYSLSINDDVIIIDIGGRTTDIAYIMDKKLKMSSTIVVGTLSIYKEVADRLNSLYSLDLDIQAAEKIINKGYFQIDWLRTDLSFMTEIIKQNFNKINADLTMKFPARTEKIVLVGGGYKIFEKTFKKRYKNSFVADNPIFANSIGFKEVADRLWN